MEHTAHHSCHLAEWVTGYRSSFCFFVANSICGVAWYPSPYGVATVYLGWVADEVINFFNFYYPRRRILRKSLHEECTGCTNLPAWQYAVWPIMMMQQCSASGDRIKCIVRRNRIVQAHTVRCSLPGDAQYVCIAAVCTAQPTCLPSKSICVCCKLS